jgi:hypothetical protein
MKKVFKGTARHLLGALGLEVHRRPRQLPDQIPSGDFHLLWRDWINLAPLRFAYIYAKNRQTQRAVSKWISADVLEDSLWRYGIPGDNLLEDLNRVESVITYTDILSFLSTLLTDPRYLEIGVSAGKNFYQMSKQLDDALLVGLDIEDINPVLEGLYHRRGTIWESANLHPFIKYDGIAMEKRFTLTEFSEPENSNRIYYLSGDKFEEELWQSLEGMCFNLVFSDACHTPESIETELEFMLQSRLIDPSEFIMMWDDVNEERLPSVLRATTTLSQRFPNKRPYAAVVDIHGTYGGGGGALHRMALFISDSALRPGSDTELASTSV